MNVDIYMTWYKQEEQLCQTVTQRMILGCGSRFPSAWELIDDCDVKECELARLIEALESINIGDAEGNELESMFKLVVF
jgi:hypothetical protein